MLEKTLESLLDCKEIQPVNPKWNQSWIFIGRTDAKAETPILWPPDAKNWLIGKDPDAGKDWRQEEKGTTEDKMVGWHHRLNGHEFKQSLGVGDGQGSLVCCSPRGRKELHTTKWLELKWTVCLEVPTCVTWFNCSEITMRKELFSFNREENWGSKNLEILPKSGIRRVRFKTRYFPIPPTTGFCFSSPGATPHLFLNHPPLLHFFFQL